MESYLSKSERKRRAKNIEQLVHELAELPESEINMFPCDDEIRTEFCSVQALKGGARKRQLKYITKLLRGTTVDALYDFLASRKGSQLKRKREFHQLEHLRNLLIDEVMEQYEDNIQKSRYVDEHDPLDFSWESKAMAAISEQFPDIDQTQLKNIAVQFARTRHRKFSRELFRILKGAFDKMQYAQTKDGTNGVQER
jgi:ribosome-associated protein